jgi:hypothetical protein
MSSFSEQDANYANCEREAAFEYPLDPDLFNLDAFDETTHQSPSSAKQSSMGCLGGFKSLQVESANGMSECLEGEGVKTCLEVILYWGLDLDL